MLREGSRENEFMALFIKWLGGRRAQIARRPTAPPARGRAERGVLSRLSVDQHAHHGAEGHGGDVAVPPAGPVIAPFRLAGDLHRARVGVGSGRDQRPASGGQIPLSSRHSPAQPELQRRAGSSFRHDPPASRHRSAKDRIYGINRILLKRGASTLPIP